MLAVTNASESVMVSVLHMIVSVPWTKESKSSFSLHESFSRYANKFAVIAKFTICINCFLVVTV